MPIQYLKASDIENDITRRHARLSGIANEIYILLVESKGTNYNIGSYGTLYGNLIFPKMDDTGVIDPETGPIYNQLDDWALAMDTESDQYAFMIQLHKDKLVDEVDLINDGWDLIP